jgi:hypothetical protein
VLSEWRDWVESALKSRVFSSAGLDPERLWATARVLVDERTLYERPLPIVALRERMLLIGPTDFLVHRDQLLPFAELARKLDDLEAHGETVLSPPWPVADLDPPVDRRFYSSERLLERARRVYEQAIESYRGLVLDFFPSFAPRLHHFQILPAHFIGKIKPPSPGRTDDALVSHWQPLPRDEASEVLLSLNLDDPIYDPADDDRIWDVFRQARPEMRILPGRAFQLIDLWTATPASNIAYEWLWDDLKALSWVDGPSPRWTIA